MNIAVVGGGLAGLAALWHLLEQASPSTSITLIEKNDAISCASSVAAGLLHPYLGMRASRDLYATQGLKETLHLLQIAEKYFGKPVFQKTGVLRPIQHAGQQHRFFSRSQEYPEETEWWDLHKVAEQIQGLIPMPGLFIKEGCTVDLPNYLQGLRLACKAKGARFINDHILSLKQLTNYDKVLIAAGSGTLAIKECANLPLTSIKGQVLSLQWPEELPIPKIALGSHPYLIVSKERIATLGATFERSYLSAAPDPDFAKKELLNVVATFLPQLKGATVLDCRSGVRLSYGRHPLLLTSIPGFPHCQLFTGLGSRGLLHHAFFGKQAASTVIST